MHFEELTSEQLLPHASPQVALTLLTLERKLCIDSSPIELETCHSSVRIKVEDDADEVTPELAHVTF